MHSCFGLLTMTTTITSCPRTHRNYVHHYVITELYTVHYKYKSPLLDGRAKKVPDNFQKWLHDTDYQRTKPSIRSFTLSPYYYHIFLLFSCDFFSTVILPTTCTCILSPFSFFILTIQHQLPTIKTPPDEDQKV